MNTKNGFKDYLATQILNKKLRFVCDCLIPLNHEGVVVDYEINNNEIIFIVDIGGKVIKIGENHPNLQVFEL